MPDEVQTRARSYGPWWAHVTDWRRWPGSREERRRPFVRWAPGDRRFLVVDGGRFVAYLRLAPWRQS